MLDTEQLAMAVLRYGPAIPVTAAICGGATAAMLGKKIADGKKKFTASNALIVGSDLLAMIAVITLVAPLFIRGGSTRPEMLSYATALQAILALLILIQLSLDMVRDRPDNGQQTGARIDSRNIAGPSGVSSLTAERSMLSTLTRQDRVHIIERGRRQYERIRSKVERAHSGQRIAISVKTGRFTTAVKGPEFRAFAGSLDKDDYVWMTRVGAA